MSENKNLIEKGLWAPQHRDLLFLMQNSKFGCAQIPALFKGVVSRFFVDPLGVVKNIRLIDFLRPVLRVDFFDRH